MSRQTKTRRYIRFGVFILKWWIYPEKSAIVRKRFASVETTRKQKVRNLMRLISLPRHPIAGHEFSRFLSRLEPRSVSNPYDAPCGRLIAGGASTSGTGSLVRSPTLSEETSEAELTMVSSLFSRRSERTKAKHVSESPERFLWSPTVVFGSRARELVRWSVLDFRRLQLKFTRQTPGQLSFQPGGRSKFPYKNWPINCGHLFLSL